MSAGDFDKVKDFLAKGLREMFPARIDMDNYHGPKPWARDRVSNLPELLRGFDHLLAQHGPRKDLALPAVESFDERIRGLRRSMGRSLDSYDQWRNRMSPFDRPMEDMHDLNRVIHAYDKLYAQHGPRADYHLPEVRHNLHMSSGGGLSRHDIPMRIILYEIGSTLEDFGIWEEERAARRRGEWVKDRGMVVVADSWSRMVAGPDGASMVERTEDRPAQVFDARAAIKRRRAGEPRPEPAGPKPTEEAQKAERLADLQALRDSMRRGL
jgi:hypothetical protein